MDALSDITGISIDNVNNDECASEHSNGSGASDNTEILLNQNVSLNELDGDDSLLESVSQVGEQEAYHSQNNYPMVSRNKMYQDSSFLSTYGVHTGSSSQGLFEGGSSEVNRYLTYKCKLIT